MTSKAYAGRGALPYHVDPIPRDRIANVTTTTFDELVLRGNGPMVVEFMSYGCAHCRIIEPIIQHVAQMEEAKETFFRVNMPVEPDLGATYQVRGTPTLVMFLDGREVGRVEGPHPSTSSVLAAVTEPFGAAL